LGPMDIFPHHAQQRVLSAAEGGRRMDIKMDITSHIRRLDIKMNIEYYYGGCLVFQNIIEIFGKNKSAKNLPGKMEREEDT
jgi:hypothetical protein